jgi:serine/threonine protein kinase
MPMSADPAFDTELARLSRLEPAALATALAAIDDPALRERLAAHFEAQTTEAIGTTTTTGTQLATLPPTISATPSTTGADTAVLSATGTDDTTPAPTGAQPPPNDQVEGIRPGSRIGAYTVDAWVGDGGSASVYRGHRLVEGLRQTVAIKLLRVGLHAVEVRQQFDRERRVLSMLEHGSIARWIDGGVTREGLAYLVLEYVDGQSITSFARARQLSMQARIELMIEVATAVDAAHRALIVHRDLKPGNLMVNESGQVKLLDFGIAKLLQADAEQQTQVQMYTPAYAAPEQREGGPITTATDVYAMGVILGELLTGKRFSSTTSRAPSLEVPDEPPEPGSLPVPPGKLRQLLKGDLDNILLKALAADPAHRYPSAAVFAEDLRRALDGRPVLAHPPSAGYRIRKFVRRHRISVALVSLLSIGIVLASILSVAFAIRAQQASERAQLSFAASLQAVNDLSRDLARSLRESRGIRSETVSDVLQKARSLLESIEATDPGNPAIELARIELLLGFSGAHRSVANTAAAQAALQEALRRIEAFEAQDHALPARVRVDALLAQVEQHEVQLQWSAAITATRDALALLPAADSAIGTEDATRIWQARRRLATAQFYSNQLAELIGEANLPALRAALSRNDLAADATSAILDLQVTLASSLNQRGQTAEAAELRKELVSATERALARFPNSAEILNTQLRLINLEVNQRLNQGETDVAALLDTGIDEARRAIDANPNAVSLRLAAKSLYNQRARWWRAQGQLDRELADLQAARDLLKELADRDPEHDFLLAELSFSERRVGDALLAQLRKRADPAQLAAAEAATETALRIDRTMYAKDPARPFARRYLSASLELRGDLQHLQRRYPEAEAAYAESLQLREALAAAFPQEAAWTRLVAQSHGRHKDLAAARGDLQAARAAQDRAIDRFDRLRQQLATPAAQLEWFDAELRGIELLLLGPAEPDARREAARKLAELGKLLRDDPAWLGTRPDLSAEFSRLQRISQE